MSWQKLIQVIEKLRSPEGCPWDREQTHDSLKRFLLEESYELFEAIDQADDEAIKDELGDVLLQILLHAQIAKERNAFDITDVITNLRAKLIRRHPHVFSTALAETPQEVMVNWDEIKKTEAGAEERKSALDGIPTVFPALMRAEKIQKKAAKVGFDWDDTGGVLEKIREEIGEVEEVLATGSQGELEEELGDLLFAIVNLARFVEIDPEFALQKATDKFYQRFRHMELAAEQDEIDLADLSLAELDVFWEQAKCQLRKKPQV